MINPNKVHRSRATITEINHGAFIATLPSGHKLKGWDLPSKFNLGEQVNIQSQFSICLDGYYIKTVNKVRK